MSCHPPSASGTTWSIVACLPYSVVVMLIGLWHKWHMRPYLAITSASVVGVLITALSLALRNDRCSAVRILLL